MSSTWLPSTPPIRLLECRGTGAACLQIALALVDAHNLVLIDLLPRRDKQPPALLHALNGVRSHLQ